MSAISGVSSQALQYVQANSQPKATAAPAQQLEQPAVPSVGKDADGDNDGSVGSVGTKIDTYA